MWVQRSWGRVAAPIKVRAASGRPGTKGIAAEAGAGADVKGMKGQRGGCGCEVSGEREASRHAGRAAALRWRQSEQMTRSAHGARSPDQVGRPTCAVEANTQQQASRWSEGLAGKQWNGSMQGQQVRGGETAYHGESVCMYGRACVRMPAELS